MGLLLAAAVVLLVLGVVHSALGEALFFRHIGRVQGFPVILGTTDFPKRTLRVTWHIPSILASALALILCRFSYLTKLGEGEWFVIKTISVSLLLCAVVTFIGTRGKHPGWVGFLAPAVLCWLAASSTP
jgi:hypothetical protein